MEVTLSASLRSSTGKGAARQARKAGLIPAILYGTGLAPLPIAVDAKQMGHTLHTRAGSNILVNLDVQGDRSYLTMVREIQSHPVRGTLLHIDFVNTARDVKTYADVPVHITGQSRGVREGGIIEHHLWELRVQALPGDIPESLTGDITHLGIGDQLRVADVVVPTGVEIETDPEEIILSVVESQATRAAELIEAELREAGVIGPEAEGAAEEGAPEQEAREEGEAAAE